MRWKKVNDRSTRVLALLLLPPLVDVLLRRSAAAVSLLLRSMELVGETKVHVGQHVEGNGEAHFSEVPAVSCRWPKQRSTSSSSRGVVDSSSVASVRLYAPACCTNGGRAWRMQQRDGACDMRR